ncbi:hypothetical protein [Isoptericola nanjingensis]
MRSSIWDDDADSVRRRIELIGPSVGLVVPRTLAAYSSKRLRAAVASSTFADRSAGTLHTQPPIAGGTVER